MSSQHIVCFGQDPLLLETRQKLAAVTFDAVSVANLDQLERLPATPAVDLLILCHTLSEQQCQAAATLTHRRWPTAQILSLCSDSVPCHPVSEHVLDTLEGPSGFLRAIAGILEEPVHLS